MDQFLFLARVMREREASRILKAFRGTDADNAGTMDVVDAAELPDVLLDLGYMPPLPEVVQECVTSCSFEDTRELTFEDLCRVMEKLREAAEFSRSEAQEIAHVFWHHDEDADGGVSGLELERSIRNFGYATSFEQTQEILDDFDLDETGQLEERELRNAMARFRRAEMSKVAQYILFQEAENPPGDGRTKVSVDVLPTVLEDIGYELRHDSDLLQECVECGAVEHVDVWGLARLVANYRMEQRDEIRRRRGFTKKQVDQFRRELRQHDSKQKGALAGKQLRQLVGNLIPDVTRNSAAHKQAAELLQVADMDGSGAVDEEEFLEMMQLVRDYSCRTKLQKERLAVKETRFSRSELKEFRRVFRMFDTDESKDMGFEELQRMLVALFGNAATGHLGTAELQQIYASFDENSGGTLDFPEFLRVLRCLMDSNWRGINDKIAEAITTT